MEPAFRQELQCIRQVSHLQYIIAMIVWFHQWRQEQGWWPSLPDCSFKVGALATAIIKTQVVLVTSEIKMTPGERQVLWVLTTLLVPGQSGPQEPISRACCPQCAVHCATSAAGRNLIYASCCTGICHFN